MSDNHIFTPAGTMPAILVVYVSYALQATAAPDTVPVEDVRVSDRLTLESCLDIALDRNPLVQAARYGVAIADADVGAAKAPYYPELSLSMGWNRFQRRAYLPSGLEERAPSPIIGPKTDWLAGVTARYTLLDGGRRAAELRRALAAKKGAKAEEAGMIQDLVFEVAQSFYALAAAKQVNTVAEDNLERARTHLHLAQRRYGTGAAPKADVLRAEVEVAEAELALVRAAGAAQVARGQLSVAMGLPPYADYEIDVVVAHMPEFALSDVEVLIEQAVERRPDIEVALRQMDAGSAGVAAAKSAWRPRLFAEAGYQFRDEEFLPKDEEWFAGINLNWTIFSGFSRRHGVARAKAELSRQEALHHRAVLQVQQEVWAAYSKALETWSGIQTAETQAADARESLRMMRIRYEVEAATINDLLDAQTALARAETNHAATLWDYRIALAWLERVQGKNHRTSP